MDCKVEEFNGETDHIHVLIEYPPKLSISQLVNSFKGVSSRRYGQAGFKKPYGKEALWSPSYFASSVGGAPIEVLKAYIQNQDKPTAENTAESCRLGSLDMATTQAEDRERLNLARILLI